MCTTATVELCQFSGGAFNFVGSCWTLKDSSLKKIRLVKFTK